MTPDDLRRAIASGDEQSTRIAIRAAGQALREGRAVDPTALLTCLAPLATHRSPIVRQAVADVCDAFPDAPFDELHRSLLADGDRYVRAAAEAAGHRHARTLRRAAREKVPETRVAALLAEIERTTSGKQARRLAERAIEHGVEHFAAQLDHEVSKTQPSIHRALAALELEVERPERSFFRMKEQIATIRERSRFAYSMIRRARDYAERAKPVFADLLLVDVVNEARAQLVDRLGPRAAKLAFTSDVDPALRIEADRYLLMQALQNVFQNAAEAYDGNDAERLAVRVSATTRRGGSEIVLVVADDGAGIAAERRETMFVPFKSQKPGGSGLGLLIVRRSVEEVHGGVLTIDGPPGEGTRVTMILPAKQERR